MHLKSLFESKFQFHKGTIKTKYRQPLGKLYSLFQFHKGTIKTGVLGWLNTYEFVSIP